MLLNAQQLALEILSNMCCPDGEISVSFFTKNITIVHIVHVHIVHFQLHDSVVAMWVSRSKKCLLWKRSSWKCPQFPVDLKTEVKRYSTFIEVWKVFWCCECSKWWGKQSLWQQGGIHGNTATAHFLGTCQNSAEKPVCARFTIYCMYQ